MKKETLQIDLVYDIICPWCYIGHQRLMNAIKATTADVEVCLIPFQIRPQLPLEGISIKEYWSAKGITNIDAAYEAIVEAADVENLIINPHQFSVLPNTLKIHQLILKAKEKRVGMEVLHAIQKAFFEKGVDLTKIAVLKEIVKEYLSGDEVLEVWNSTDYEKKVLMHEEAVKELKIHKVPTFVVNKKHRFSGAISNFMLKDMLNQLVLNVEDGEACGIEGNC